jgi:hypothetical protein
MRPELGKNPDVIGYGHLRLLNFVVVLALQSRERAGMTEKLTTATAVRAGNKVIYVAEAGEIIALVPNQMRAVIAHQDRPPKFLNFDGTTEPIEFDPNGAWTTVRAFGTNP